MILLVADLQELKANPKRDAIGTIVEAKLDKGRGPVATALVQTGTLKVGDIIVVGETFGRVRALENDLGKRVTKAGPSSAVVILGLSDVPQAGDILRVVSDEKEARTMVESRKAATAAKTGEGSGRATLEDLYSQIQAGQAKELRIILKRDVSGSLGAITHALEQLDQDEIRLNVLLEGAGDITDNDIMLAAASNAIVVGFNTKITDTARRAAEAEGVDVRLYDIIYKLTDDVEAALKGLLEPEVVEVVEGRAEVRQIIRVGKNTVIAGSFVTDGRIVRGGNARVWRSSKVIATDRIESLRRFRDDVREVLAELRVRHRHSPNFHEIRRATSSSAITSPDGRGRRARRGQLTACNCDPPRFGDSSMSQRTERVDELLRQEIGAIVSREVADPRIGFATITGVETTHDLRHAKVWVSVIGQPAERDAAVAALRHAMPFVRHELGKRLRIKRIPDLHVHLDDTAERGTRILQLLAELETGSIPDPDVAVAESLPTPGRPRCHHEYDLTEEPPSAVCDPATAASAAQADRPRARRRPARAREPRKGAR